MKAMAKFSRTMAITLLAAVALVGTFPAQATVLSFTINDSTDTTPAPGYPSLTGPPHNAYGDNVTSGTMSVGAFTYHYGSTWGFTPDITVDYSTGGHLNANTLYYYGDSPPPIEWPGADYLTDSGVPNASGRDYYWTFTPTAGKGVRINSFELFGYDGTTGAHSGSWTIHKDSSGGPVLDAGVFAFSAATQYNTPFVVTTAQLDYMGTLVLEVDHTAGNGGGFALDDLAFNQEIPEPSSALLLLAGVTLIWRRWERTTE